MRVAVFTNQFPSRVSTFFAWDMAALRAAGVDLDVYAIWPGDDSLWAHVPTVAGEAPVPPDRVHHLRGGEALAGLARLGGRRRGARFWAGAVGAVAASVRWGPSTVAKSAYVAPKAWAWAGRDGAGDYDHVLAYWGNHAATCAWLFARAHDLPMSMLLHASVDLYFQRALLGTKVKAAAAVLPVCEFNRRFLAEHCPRAYAVARERVHVHHPGIDLERFAFHGGDREPATVLAIGRLDPQKGYLDLVDAVAAAPGIELELVGDGPQRAALEKRVAHHGLGARVHFRGWQGSDGVRAAMQRATLLAHPSPGLGDAVPTVIKEALAVGLPVIGTDAVGIPELLDHGRAGVLVPPRDPAALAGAISALVADGDRRAELATTGRAHAEATFDARRNGRRLAAILEKATVAA